MNYYDFEVNGKSYKLRLNTRSIVALEKKLGCNPIGIFGKGDTIPTIGQMVEVLHASMTQLNHGITLDEAYDIFDQWIEEGHTATDFIPIIVEIYKFSGIIKIEKNDIEKN